ncbi:MAG: hypothetical protein IJ174_02850 [Clostridia bacterium]|nr:hypothetical protein [Clostridia bacterium]
MENKSFDKDERTPLARGAALTVRIGHEKRRLVVRKCFSFGRECLNYLAESRDAGGGGREILVKEFYPADMGVERRGDALKPRRQDRAFFEKRRDRFLEGKSAYADLYPQGIFHYGAANGTAYALTDPAEGSVMRLRDKDETPFGVLSLFRDVAQQLSNLHENGVACPNVRCEQVFVTRRGEARLADLDTSVAFGEAVRPASKEQKTVEAGAAEDLNAFGALLFWKLSGRLPEAEEKQAILDGSFPYAEKMPLLAGFDACHGDLGAAFQACFAGEKDANAVAQRLEAAMKRLPREAERHRAEAPLEMETSVEPAVRREGRRRHGALIFALMFLLALNAVVWFGDEAWLRPLEGPAAAVKKLLTQTEAPVFTPTSGRYFGKAAWQDISFTVDQRVSGGTVILRYRIGDTECVIGRNATATAVTDAGTWTVPFMNAGQSLQPGTVSSVPMSFPELKGTLRSLTLYGFIPMNPDGQTAAQEAASVTVEIEYLSEESE